MELTQEQLDQKIADAIAEATKGTYTQAQLDAEADRRVTAGIRTSLEKAKDKWLVEYGEKANNDAKKTAMELVEERLSELEAREKAVVVDKNNIVAVNKFSKAGVPESYYENLLPNIVGEDLAVVESTVDVIVAGYIKTKEELELSIKANLSNVGSPKGGANSSSVTKEKFNAMSYGEQAELKASNPELFAQLIK